MNDNRSFASQNLEKMLLDEDISNEETESSYSVFTQCDNQNATEEIVQYKTHKVLRDLQAFHKRNVSFITEKGVAETNIINQSEKKTYNIPPTHIEEFFNLLESCRLENLFLHYSEKQAQYSGIMIDCDRYQKSNVSQITPKHFRNFSFKLTRLFISSLQLPYVNSCYTFHIFFIKKPAPKLTDAGLYKDGFHILIPEIQVTKGYKKYLLKEISGMMKTIFSDIEHIEQADKMLDMMSASVPVLFIGNSKVNGTVYPLVQGFSITLTDGDEDIDIKLLDTVNLSKGILIADGTLQTGHDEPVMQNVVNADQIVKVQKRINLCYELSLSFVVETPNRFVKWLNKQRINYKVELESKIQIIVERTSNDIIDENQLLNTDNSISILAMQDAEAAYIQKLLALLDISYATDYDKWFKVLCALANTSQSYKPLAVWFSQRCPSAMSEAEIDRIWKSVSSSNYVGEPLSKRSIIRWAKQSNPQKYKEIHANSYGQMLSNYAYQYDGNIEHSMVAKVLHLMLNDKFVVDVDEANKYSWFEFVLPNQDQRPGELYKWRKEAKPDVMNLYIADILPQIYVQVLQNIKDRLETSETEVHKKWLKSVESNLKTSMADLHKDNFQNGVIKQAEYRFRVRGFFDKLDKDGDIIGVGNGVIKLEYPIKLISSFHEYRISKFTEVPYYEYTQDNPWIQLIEKAFHDIFIEEDVYALVMMFLSMGLDRKDVEPILLLLVGGGNNGKSFALKIWHNVLGRYCVKLPLTLITGQREKSEGTNSAFMMLEGAGAAYYSESNKSEVLNTARVKEMISPEYQTGRDVFGKQKNFKSTANQIAATNHDFIIECSDHGTWRRLKYYRNKVKFCANPDPANPYEKQEDRKYIHVYADDMQCKQALLSILVHWYQILQTKYEGNIKNVPCPTIDAETEEFRNKQDTVNRFVSQMIVRCVIDKIDEDQRDELMPKPIPLSRVAIRYIEWYTQFIGVNQLTVRDVEPMFENSSITAQFRRLEDGLLYLHNMRIKNAPDEQLMPYEEPLYKSGPKNIKKVTTEINHKIPTVNRTKKEELIGISSDDDIVIQNSFGGPQKEIVLTENDFNALLS